MLELVPPGLRIDFVGKAKFCILASLLVILCGIGSIVLRGGLNPGLDFSGGTLLQLRFSQPAELSPIREALGTLGLERAIVQHYGSGDEVLIRIAQLPNEEQDLGTRVQRILQDRFPQQTVELRRAEIVGAQVSTELRQKALFALFYAILGTLVYLSGRFEAKWFVALGLAATLFVILYSITQWFPSVSPAILIVVAIMVSTIFSLILQLRYALAAIIAIYHDVLVTVGFLSFFNKEFDLQIIAALLTIIGYSLNDTIVIFDRIRENLQGRRRDDFATVVNTSVNQTLSRTLLTTGHTLLVVLAILFFGGEVLHDFAFALLIGMLAGTYSTVFIASPLLVYWQSIVSSLRVRKARVDSVRSTSA
jgi:preprotein translocase subunit SecF